MSVVGKTKLQRKCRTVLPFTDKWGEHSTLMTHLLITVPTYNDSSRVETMVEHVAPLFEKLKNARLLVADDGSTDQTLGIVSGLLSRYPWLAGSGVTSNVGRGRLLREMWSRASADIYVYMDSDLATDLSFLPRLISGLGEDCQIATGSRYLPASKTHRPRGRYIASRTYNYLLNVLFHERISDHQCGFKALSRQALNSLLPLCHDDRWFFDTELLVLGERLGLNVFELPVHWEERKWDRTSLRRLLRDTFLILPPLLRMVWRLRRMPLQTHKKQVEQVLYTSVH
jgi:hypothetical protein